MRAHPLGLLISVGEAGLTANPVPFQLVEDGPGLLLRTHLARANPQLLDLQGGGDALVVFQGPHAYVSPSWYPSKMEDPRVVPTWNYVMVQARGRSRTIEDPVWLKAQIDALTKIQEAGRDPSWHVDDAPGAFLDAQIRAIVGVEIAVDDLVGKWKVSQNRREKDRRGVVEGLSAAGENGMAALVSQGGPVGLAPDVEPSRS